MSIRLYEVNSKYIDYLIPYAPHLFHNKKPGQHNERKYIGIILIVNYICLFDYLFISSQMSAKPYFIGSTGILLLW